jgi:hypothetical protein
LSEKSVGFFSSSIAKQQVGLNETGELLNFLGTNYLKYVSAIAQHERQQREIDKQIKALRAAVGASKNSPFPAKF